MEACVLQVLARHVCIVGAGVKRVSDAAAQAAVTLIDSQRRHVNALRRDDGIGGEAVERLARPDKRRSCNRRVELKLGERSAQRAGGRHRAVHAPLFGNVGLQLRRVRRVHVEFATPGALDDVRGDIAFDRGGAMLRLDGRHGSQPAIRNHASRHLDGADARHVQCSARNDGVDPRILEASRQGHGRIDRAVNARGDRRQLEAQSGGAGSSGRDVREVRMGGTREGGALYGDGVKASRGLPFEGEAGHLVIVLDRPVVAGERGAHLP